MLNLNAMVKLQNIRILIVLGAILIASLFTYYLMNDDLDTSHKIDNFKNSYLRSSHYSSEQGSYTMAVFTVATYDFLSEVVPENVQEIAKNVKGVEKRINIMGFDTFYRESPSEKMKTSLTVVLLHGMNFKSQTWVDLGTFSLLAAMGHRVIAFDLPGYGNTPGEKVPEDKRGDFLNEALDRLHVIKPIIISPSMSGSFSLPFLFQYKGTMGGYVPVAPIFTEKYTDAEYKSVNTPTLVVYGEFDEQLGELSTNNLRQLSNNQIIMLPKAKHPAYLDQPEMFHKVLYNFLLKLSA